LHKTKYVLLIIFAGLLFSSCEKKDNSVIDPTLNFPSITSASIIPSTVDTTIVHSIAYAHVTSVDPIDNVTATVTGPAPGFPEEGIYTLKDDGIAPDSIANDGVFTGYINYTMSCRLLGAHKVVFLAKNISGIPSNNIIEFMQVTNTHNHPPVVSNLIITPKDITINTIVNLVFELTANDPDGPCNIKEVFYTGHDPRDSALTKRGLYDDGSCCLVEGTNFTSGDSVANDGIFTRRFPPASPTFLGYYVYHLRAVDYSNDTSNILTDSIYVHQ
jgi:hypothetical protein